VLSLLVPVLTLLISAIIPGAEEEGTIAQVTETVPAWLIFISVLTAAVTEEILYRGYLVERLLDLTGHKWFSGAISVFVFVLVHAAGWNWQHVFGVVLPLGIILTALYLWRRNLFFVMIVHLVINLPLVFLAQ
jgi:membrane protease YdiL (CAAX protease family)